MQTQWAEISVESPSESSEAVSALLLEFGCHGVAEQGTDIRKIVGFLPVFDQLPEIMVELEARLALMPEYGLPSVSTLTLKYAQETDWENDWKKYFRPMEIGSRLVIKPSWEEYVGDPERLIVEIDPGQAFGTGGHQTTRLCLECLDEFVEQGMVVADIGTGSGILAIAAAKLGASLVHATDIDELPRQIARENVSRNKLDGVVVIHGMSVFDTEAVQCDLVVANIIALTIIELTPSIYKRMKPHGIFIASGIVDDRESEVITALEANGFRIVEVIDEEIWRAVVAQK